MYKFNNGDRYLVTGASSGIGRQVCMHLLQAGAEVVALGRNELSLQSLTDSALRPEQFAYHLVDFSQSTNQLGDIITELAKRYGKFSGAVLAAGTHNLSPLKTLNIDHFRKTLEINLLSNIAIVQGLCRKNHNIGQGASIVVISSIAARRSDKGALEYSASKAALETAMRCIASEVASKGVRINCIAPGFVQTPMLEKMPVYSPDFLKKLEQDHPLGLGTVKNISQPVMFLLSADSSWITGTTMIVDGGYSLA